MSLCTQDEALVLVRAIIDAGVVMRTANESTDPVDADRARNFEPILLRATDRSYIFGTDDFNVAVVNNHYIQINGNEFTSMIYLQHSDIQSVREWNRNHPILPEEDVLREQ